MTQERLAERAGVSVHLIKSWSTVDGEAARLTTLTSLAHALDVSRSELLDKRAYLSISAAKTVPR